MDETLSWKKHRKIIIPVLVLLALLTFSAGFLPPEAVWITDNGNKLMQMHNFADNGTIFFEHASPANFPYGGFHFQQLSDGRIASFHSPYLPVLAAFCYRLIGNTGISLIPMLSMAGIAALLLKFPGKKRWLLPSLAATPLIFYSLLLWEMVPAALAVTLGAWLFFRKRFTLAGMVLGLGLWMREELYLLGFCLLIVLIIQRQWQVIKKMALGSAVPVLALWITNYWLYGSVAGIHGTAYFINNRTGFSLLIWLKECGFNFYQQLIRFDTLPRWSWAAVLGGIIPVLAAGAAPGYRSWRVFKLVAGIVFTLISLVLAVFLWRQKSYLLITASTAGLFISMPVMLGFLLNYRALWCDCHRNIAWGAAVLSIYTLLLPFLLNPNDIGLTWGSRHFIIVMPLFLLLSDHALTKAGFFRKFDEKILFSGVVAAGIVMQVYALYALVKVADDNEFLQKNILSLPQKTVVSDLFFLPEMTPLVPFAKEQLEVSNPEQLRSALEYLDKSGQQSFILILSPHYRRLANEELAKLLYRYKVRSKPVNIVVGNSLIFTVAVCVK